MDAVNLPDAIKERVKIDARLGIKSSLSPLRPVVAALYILYIASNKSVRVNYTEEYSEDGNIRVKLDSNLANAITQKFGINNVVAKINATQLIKSQIEPLQVATELFLGLCKINTCDARSERTGNNRYNKFVEFTTNMIELDLLLSSLNNDERNSLLDNWLSNSAANSETEDKLTTLISLWIEPCLYKFYPEGKEETIFNMESIYSAFDDNENVSIKSTREASGPLRILRAYLMDGLHPFLNKNRDDIVSIKQNKEDLFNRYKLMLSNKLDLSAREGLSKENTPSREAVKSENGVSSYLSAIRTKPFLLLAGISGTGKSRIVRKLAQATTTFELEGYANIEELNANRWDLHKPANFEIIQVKPNWHNSMDVVGYQTNIPTPRYVFTPFVEFIAKAWQHPTVPFFLCLDEMNLAPVEEYFAEFLSAIESRSKKGDTYETDPIIKPFNDFNYEDEQGKIRPLAENMVNHLLPGYNAGNMPQNIIDLSKRFKEKGLTLPENLVVIGTVNMDETTFSFSRKVLDRAMSFEMNEVDYDSFLEDTADIITEPLTAKASTLLVDRPIKAQDVKDKVDADFIVSYLKAVNEKLDNTPFKLGYRAANEAILYVAASQNFCQKNIASVIDEFTTMKILSRIEGDTTKLRVDDNSDKTILDELETVINDFLKPANKPAVPQEEQPAEENANGEDNAPVKDVVVAAPVELKSLDKIKRMKEQLKRNSFVSYWD